MQCIFVLPVLVEEEELFQPVTESGNQDGGKQPSGGEVGQSTDAPATNRLEALHLAIDVANVVVYSVP